MNKLEFLRALEGELSRLPETERMRSVGFYAEAIDDRVEDGMTEEDAVAAMGSVGEVAEKIMMETPLPVLVRSRANTGSRTLNIVLGIVGFPIWFPLLVAFSAILLAIYAVILTLVAVLWVCVAAIGVAGLGGIAASVTIFAANPPAGAFIVGAGLALCGLTLFMFFPALYASKGLIKLTGLTARGVKRLVIGKKENEK